MTSSNAHRNATESKLTESLAFRLIATALFVAVAFALTGCSGSFDPKLSGGATTSGAGATFTGRLHGGQQPIANAYIFVFEVGEAGYPGGGVVANQSIISSTTPGGFNGTVNGNSYGPYVLTDSNGNFSFTLSSCTTGDGVYVVSYQGQPITGQTNVAASEMAAIGICPNSGVAGLLQNTPFVNVTEVSTVAFAYAMAGFTAAGQDFSHISTSATNITAMQNAFNLAQQLFSVSTTGGANTSSASLAGAIFDAGKINLMANVLSDCINSNGSASGPCGTLFQNATSNGVTGSGSVPGDTITAMINITHNVMSNVSTILNLANNSYTPYTPTTTTATGDLSLSVVYSSPANMYDPFEIAIDSSGNVYADSEYIVGGTVSPRVARISPTSGVVGSSALSALSSIAIDKSNNVFFATDSSPTVSEYAQGTSTSVLGAAASGSPFSFSYESGKTIDPVHGFAVGPNNDLLLANLYPANSIVDIPLSSGSYTTPLLFSSTDNDIHGLSESGTGVVWVIDEGQGYIEEYMASNGTLLSYVSNPNGYQLIGGALDSLGNLWFAVNGSSGIGEQNNSGQSFGRYTGQQYPVDPAIDGLDTIWMENQISCSLNMFTGQTLGANAGNLTEPYGAALAVKNCSTSNPSSGPIDTVSIDQGGNVWVPVRSNNTVYSPSGFVVEILGLAAPTIQPIALQEVKEYYGNTATDIRP